MKQRAKNAEARETDEALPQDAPLDQLPAASLPTENAQETILLIDDSEDLAALVRSALHKHGNHGYRLQCAATLSAGLGRIAEGGVDLVLLDLGLPDCAGPLSYVWVRESSPTLPFVVVTGDRTERTLLEVVASGAQDFLTKDQLSGPELLQAIRVALYANREGHHSKDTARRLSRRQLNDLL